MLQIIIIFIIIVTIILLGIFFYNNNDSSEKVDNTSPNEITLKQIYNLFLETCDLLYQSKFDQIKNMDANLLFYLKTKVIVYEKIDSIIYHEINRLSTHIFVKFFVKLRNGEYVISNWIFDTYKPFIKDIDNINKVGI